MTQIEHKQDRSMIDVRADEVLAVFQKQQKNDQERKETEQTRQDQQDVAVLQTLIKTEFEPALLEALHIRYIVHRDGHSRRPEAVVRYAGLLWHIYQDFYHRSPTPWRWHISATRNENGYGYQESTFSREAEPHTLQTILLLKFGERREQLRKQAEEAAHKEEQQRLIAAQRQTEQEHEERIRAERIAKADQEDAHWREELATLKQRKLEDLWRWPAGVQIYLYHLTYTTAMASDENGDPLVETEGGWTAIDHLDADGYIQLQPMKSYYSTSAAREVKLDTAIHRPIWERHAFGSVEKLPDALRQEVTVSIDHVVKDYNPDLDETPRKPRLTKVEEYGYEDNGPYTESVGYIPLPWVRALVEHQAVLAESTQHAPA